MNKETLEEVAERIYPDCNNVIRQMAKETFIKGAKWQQEQDKNKYSEEEVLSILEDYDREFKLNTFSYTVPCRFTVREWFEKKTKL